MDEDFLDLIDQAFLEGQIDGETGTGGVSTSQGQDGVLDGIATAKPGRS